MAEPPVPALLEQSVGGASGTDAPVAVAQYPRASGGVDVVHVPGQRGTWLNGRYRATDEIVGGLVAYVKVGDPNMWGWFHPEHNDWKFGSRANRGTQCCYMYSSDQGAATPQDCELWICGSDKGFSPADPSICVQSSRPPSRHGRAAKRGRDDDGGSADPNPRGGQAVAFGGGGAASGGQNAPTRVHISHPNRNSRRPKDVKSFKDRKDAVEIDLGAAQKHQQRVEAEHTAFVLAAQQALDAAKVKKSEVVNEASCAVVRVFFPTF